MCEYALFKLTYSVQEYDDSLTPEQIEAGKKRRRPKSKKLKPEDFPRPMGIVGDVMDALMSVDKNKWSQIVSDNILREEASKHLNAQDFIQKVNQPIDFQDSTLLHLAARKNAIDIIW
jgi:hypothetical protein